MRLHSTTISRNATRSRQITCQPWSPHWLNGLRAMFWPLHLNRRKNIHRSARYWCKKKPIKIVPKLGRGDHAWAANPLPKSAFSAAQQRCLAEGIYFEARGEPVSGQAAVSQVILNRVRNPHYPNTICGVVYQNKHWRNRCQFSFACDRIRDPGTRQKELGHCQTRGN